MIVCPEFPLLFFCFEDFIVTPPAPHHFTMSILSPPLLLSLFPMCLNMVFLAWLFFFIFLNTVYFSWSPLFYRWSPFCFWFCSVLLLVPDCFPKVTSLSLLSLLNFMLTFWTTYEMAFILLSDASNLTDLNSNQHLSPSMDGWLLVSVFLPVTQSLLNFFAFHIQYTGKAQRLHFHDASWCCSSLGDDFVQTLLISS